jgi:hypothetical protein
MFHLSLKWFQPKKHVVALKSWHNVVSFAMLMFRQCSQCLFLAEAVEELIEYDIFDVRYCQ